MPFVKSVAYSFDINVTFFFYEAKVPTSYFYTIMVVSSLFYDLIKTLLLLKKYILRSQF